MCSQAIQIIVKYHVNFLLYCKNKGVIPLINCVQVITWVHNLLDPKSFFFSPHIQLTIIMFCFALTISLDLPDFPVLNPLLFFIFLPPTSFSLLSQLWLCFFVTAFRLPQFCNTSPSTVSICYSRHCFIFLCFLCHPTH